MIISFLTGGCTLPQYIWPQKDMESYEINRPDLEKKVLVASRHSEFKNAIVKKIKETFYGEPVYVKIIGIDNLKYEDADDYTAVVLINTSMGWEIDHKAEAFLDKYGTSGQIIVLTTSGGGDILPDMQGRSIVAISSASVLAEIEPVADAIIGKIRLLTK